MSRFIGILLMLSTGAVVAELIAGAHFTAGATGTTLAIAFVVLGWLLGVLATARQWLWAILGSLAAVLPQVISGRVPLPPPAGDVLRTVLLLAVPPLALLLGSLAGTRLLERRLQARVKPEHED